MQESQYQPKSSVYFMNHSPYLLQKVCRRYVGVGNINQNLVCISSITAHTCCKKSVGDMQESAISTKIQCVFHQSQPILVAKSLQVICRSRQYQPKSSVYFMNHSPYLLQKVCRRYVGVGNINQNLVCISSMTAHTCCKKSVGDMQESAISTKIQCVFHESQPILVAKSLQAICRSRQYQPKSAMYFMNHSPYLLQKVCRRYVGVGNINQNLVCIS